jgi:hypothetical protein
MLSGLAAQDDPAVIEMCRGLFAHGMNDDPAAWEALGTEFHERLTQNYVTWVRRYVAPGVLLRFSPAELTGAPVIWTIGGLNPAATFMDNVVLAVQAGIDIGLLMCKHFPQVSAPEMLAQHIAVSALGA